MASEFGPGLTAIINKSLLARKALQVGTSRPRYGGYVRALQGLVGQRKSTNPYAGTLRGLLKAFPSQKSGFVGGLRGAIGQKAKQSQIGGLFRGLQGVVGQKAKQSQIGGRSFTDLRNN